MYIGRYYHSLETKNRVSLPAKLRQQLGTEGIATRGFDGCVILYDMQTWEKELLKLEGLRQTKRAAREYLRYITNDALEIEVDKQGRILLSEALKEQAGLHKEVVVVGAYDHIEIWDRAAYHTYMDTVRTRIEDQVETLEL